MAFIGAVIKVKGVVQGVGFRYWCHRKATNYGLGGYAANLHDGSVEIGCEGDRGIVEAFIEDLRVGPTYAHITDISIKWYEEPKGYNDFTITFIDKYE